MTRGCISLAAYQKCSFKVGDLIIGTKLASERYGITRCNTIWSVSGVYRNGSVITVDGVFEFGTSGCYDVDPKCFKHFCGGKVE